MANLIDTIINGVARVTGTLFASKVQTGQISTASGSTGTAGNVLKSGGTGNFTWGTLSASDVGAATSGHTHTTSLTSGGTATVNLAANTAYTLTAGGTSVIFKTPADTNTTYSNFVKSGTGAAAGLVPAPSTTAGTTKYLREDGTWQVPPDNNTTYSAEKGISLTSGKFGHSNTAITAQTTAGLYKVAYDAYGHITSTTAVAKADITGLGIPGSDTTYSAATQSAAGLMSAADKTKLDGIASGANAYTHPTSDGSKHVPANGTGNNGKFLQATATAGTYQWVSLPTASTTAAGIIQIGTGATNAAAGNHSHDYSGTYAAKSHTHGNIQNGGTLQTNDVTVANGDKLVITDSSDSSKIARTSISFDGTTTTKALTPKGTWETFNNYSHPTTDGNKHVPANGTGNNGKFLQATATAGTYQWASLPTASTSAAGIIQIGTGATNAAAGNHTHAYSSLTGKPTLGDAASRGVISTLSESTSLPTGSAVTAALSTYINSVNATDSGEVIIKPIFEILDIGVQGEELYIEIPSGYVAMPHSDVNGGQYGYLGFFSTTYGYDSVAGNAAVRITTRSINATSGTGTVGQLKTNRITGYSIYPNSIGTIPLAPSSQDACSLVNSITINVTTAINQPNRINKIIVCGVMYLFKYE